MTRPDVERNGGQREAVEGRYLETLKQRVSWQTQAAERERGGGTAEPPPVATAEAAPVAPAEPAAEVPGRFWLDVLESRIEQAGASRPERVGEWRYTLFCLRSYATLDGRLPARFDRLVEDVFGEVFGNGVD